MWSGCNSIREPDKPHGRSEEGERQGCDYGQARELLKKTLNKGEAEAAFNAYNSPDVYNLPAGNTAWRLSNAISWIAGQTEEPERKLDLMRLLETCFQRQRKCNDFERMASPVEGPSFLSDGVQR